MEESKIIGYAKKHPSKILAPHMVTNKTGVVRKIVEYIAPHEHQFYPGRHKIVLATLPRRVTWQAVQHWQKGGKIPADIADAWIKWLDDKVAEAIELREFLRPMAKPKRKRAPEGWRNKKS